MFITKKALEEKIARAVMEAQRKEDEQRYLSERFRDIERMFDERWHYLDQRVSRLEAKENINTECCGDVVKMPNRL